MFLQVSDDATKVVGGGIVGILLMLMPHVRRILRDKFSADAKKHEADVARHKSDMEDERAERERLQRRVDELEKQNDELRQKLDEQDTEYRRKIDDLFKRVGELEQKRCVDMRELAGKEVEIIRLKGMLADSEDLRSQMEHENAMLQQRIEQLTAKPQSIAVAVG